MSTVIMYVILITWAGFVFWRMLHYVIILPKKIKPKKTEVQKALTKYPQNFGEIGIKILEQRKFLPRKPNIFGFYDKTFPLMDFGMLFDHLKALTLEGVATKTLETVSEERAKRIGKPTEECFALKQTA